MDLENREREREELYNRYSFLKDIINKAERTLYIYKKIDPNAPGDNIVYDKYSTFNLQGCPGFQRYTQDGFKHTTFDFDTLIDEYIEESELTKTDNPSTIKEFIKYLLRETGYSNEQLAYNVILLSLDHDNDKEATKHDIYATLNYINRYWHYYDELFNINSNKKLYDKCYEKMIEYNYIAPKFDFAILYEFNTFAYIKKYKTQEEQDEIKQIYINYISQQLKKINETPEYLTIERNEKIENVHQGFDYYNLINCQLLNNDERNNFMLICLNNLCNHIETKLIALDLANDIREICENPKKNWTDFIFDQDVYKKCVNICSHKEEYLKMHQQWLQNKALAQREQDLQQMQQQIKQQTQEKTQKQIQK